MLRRILLLALTLSVAGGCATNAGGYRSERATTERLKQMSKEEVALKLGAPSARIVVDALRETWTYETALVSLIGGQCKVSITFEGDKVKDAIINSFDYSPVAAPMGSCRQIIRALD
jgi:outer membrane protein assembly factor BamE (lipoprotein component of BamABCDE complex)